MNFLIVATEVLLAVGVGIIMQAMSIKVGKINRRPTIGYMVLLLSAAPFVPGLPSLFVSGYLSALFMQVGIVVGVVVMAAFVPVAALLGASHIADVRMQR